MTRESYLKGAIDIGDQLIAKAKKNEEGMWWETMTLGEDGSGDWQVSESLYSGVAGIVFFLMELYKKTEDPKYLDAVTEGAKWLEKYCDKNHTSYYAFYTGRMGVSYLMIQLADFFGDDSYKTKALKIADKCEVFLQSNYKVDDLINGSSGTLLGLLHLHAATGEESLLKKIELFTDHLINNLHFGECGVYWDRSSKNITGLCGFSHGASGIGYVFLELGHYFSNPTFYRIAELAFSYENYHYSPTHGNWPDFRKGIYDEKTLKEHKEQYLKGNKEFFLSPSDMSAWCHGAPGIGLSRVRAYELLGKDEYLEDLKNAISKTIQLDLDMDTNRVAYVLCHGGGGNSILFLEADRVLNGDQRSIDAATATGDRALSYRSQYKEYVSGYAGLKDDTSLFMGDAGIGYFYLLLADGGLSHPSILKPDIKEVYEGDKGGVFSVNDSQINAKLAEKLYPKTFSCLKDKGFNFNSLNVNNKIIASVTAGFDKYVQEAKDSLLDEIWSYEKLKVELDQNVASHSYNYIKRLVETEKNRDLLNDEQLLLKATISLPDGHLLTTLQTTEGDEEESYIMLISNSEGLVEYPLSYFSYEVIRIFEQPRRISDAINDMISNFEVTNPDEVEQVKAATLAQIREAMKEGLLQLNHSVQAHERENHIH